MKIISKTSIFLLAFSIFLILQNPVKAEEKTTTNSLGVVMTAEEHQNLKNLGFTDLAIDQMDQEVFNENKNLKVDSQSTVTKYYEVKENSQESQLSRSSIQEDQNTNYTSTELTEEEYFKRVEAAAKDDNTIKPRAATDSISTSYRRLSTSIQKIGTDLRLYQKFIWDKMPATRSYDVLTISIDQTFTPISGSQYGQQLWGYIHPTTGASGGGNAKYSSSSTAWKKQSAGYGVKMNLKDNAANLRVIDLEGYMYYKIKRSSSVKPYYINAYGNYAHAKKSLSSGFSYGLDFGGPSISWSGVSSTSFDSITTHAQTRY